MKVHVHPADDGGCGWYRLRWPAEHLQAAGHDITIGAKLDCVRENNPILGDRPLQVLVEADVIVFQRPMRHELVEIIPLLQRQGTAVVVEIDDDFHSLPKTHPATKAFAPRHNEHRNWNWLRRACDLADLVTCTTPALANRYAPHGRFLTLPNCVPGRYLETDGKPNDRVTVGWTGTPTTHVGDLDVVGDAIARVQRDTGCGFRAIGSQSTLGALGVEGEVAAWCELTDDTPDGYATMVAGLDIGIVPLVGNAFNRAKSALKMCEYAALGVVPVVSPSLDNVRMFQHGIGFLADSPGDWARHVRALVNDEDLRQTEAGRARDAMRAWTYEERSGLWWEAWTLALANRRGNAAA